MNKKKMLGMIIGVIAFIALVAGATYAWFTWASGNTVLNGTTECFTIDYVGGTAIGSGPGSPAAMSMSADYTGGLSTTVTMSIAAACNITGTGSILLTTTQTGYTGTYTAGLKYQVVSVGAGDVETPVAGGAGAISEASQITLATFPLTTTATTYKVYVWLDGSMADNTAAGTQYAGYIHARADQTQA